ncbi:MAG: hypothetical protein JHC74_06615 [Thermoleophilia bacterium]|nr:hypothetical protein [Thermoleophilia bacterium]
MEDGTGRVVVSGHRARDTGDPAWIDFPPRWPEAPGQGARRVDAEHERPAVVLTTPIPRLGRRERPRVLRIVTGVRPR